MNSSLAQRRLEYALSRTLDCDVELQGVSHPRPGLVSVSHLLCRDPLQHEVWLKASDVQWADHGTWLEISIEHISTPQSRLAQISELWKNKLKTLSVARLAACKLHAKRFDIALHDNLHRLRDVSAGISPLRAEWQAWIGFRQAIPGFPQDQRRTDILWNGKHGALRQVAYVDVKADAPTSGVLFDLIDPAQAGRFHRLKFTGHMQTAWNQNGKLIGVSNIYDKRPVACQFQWDANVLPECSGPLSVNLSSVSVKRGTLEFAEGEIYGGGGAVDLAFLARFVNRLGFSPDQSLGEIRKGQFIRYGRIAAKFNVESQVLRLTGSANRIGGMILDQNGQALLTPNGDITTLARLADALAPAGTPKGPLNGRSRWLAELSKPNNDEPNQRVAEDVRLTGVR
jgi:hypothetical protein